MISAKNSKGMDPQLQHIHRYFWESYDIDGDSTENSVVTLSPDGNAVTAMWKNIRGCMVRRDTRRLLEAITAENDDGGCVANRKPVGKRNAKKMTKTNYRKSPRTKKMSSAASRAGSPHPRRI